MRRIVTALTVALVGLHTAPASADSRSTILEPSSNWYATLEDGSCRLARRFGERSTEHLLVFEQWGPSSEFGLIVAGPTAARFSDGRKTQLVFFDGQSPREIRPVKNDLDDYGSSLTELAAGLSSTPENWLSREEISALSEERAQSGFPSIDAELAAQVQYVQLSQGNRELKLMTGPMSDAFSVLDQCAEQLMVSWGFDLEAQKAQSRHPRMLNEHNAAERFWANWPSDMLQERWRGAVNVRVTVNAEGEVEDCQAANLAEIQEMQEATCNAMSGLDFDPALDAQGNPMRSFYMTSIRYGFR